jgi:hypothetical protein
MVLIHRRGRVAQQKRAIRTSYTSYTSGSGSHNRKEYICILGPAIFLQNQTVICGVPLQPQAHKQAQGLATQIHGQTGSSGRPQAQEQTQSRRGFFDK